ncbi:hypothetical protein ATY78_00980 [Rhizobium sp. R635]|uniref:hypothetical protein n=1 Tax=unclassified Rhizobium TaxID=2613769 RepID=UPI000B52B606|nr:hypothetical protein [Rhizobium sp. R635]OWV92142.1 hypothetical protein ATY78_00980 [Rhizobium sp. R635]
MIDMIAIAGIRDVQHSLGYHPKQSEDEFYAEFGDSPLVRFATWLTSRDLRWRKDRTAPARTDAGCGAQATFLAVR